MLLINCKVELKLNWTKYCVLSANGKDNDDDHANNITFSIKDKHYMFQLSLYEQETIAKDLKRRRLY